jgi:uncharacterized protein YqgQ
MLADQHFLTWQTTALAGVSSFGLTEDDAKQILSMMYRDGDSGIFTPKINPLMVNFRSKTFRHAAAEVFTSNIVPVSIKYPQLQNNLYDVAALLMNVGGRYEVLMSDRENEIIESFSDHLVHVSVFGNRPAEMLAGLDDVVFLTGKSESEVSRVLGSEIKGRVSRDISHLKSTTGKVYLDCQFMKDNWSALYETELFKPADQSISQELLGKVDSNGLAFVIVRDEDCVSQVCQY